MKKHVFIWGLVLIACGLFALFLFNPFSSSEKDKKTNISESNIDSSIEAFGKGKYKHEDYQNLNMAISSLRSNGKISNDHAESIRINLENSRQKALTTSLREWFANNCGSSEMNQLIAYAKDVSQPSAELSKEINHYQQYSQALGFSGKLRGFLSGEYSPGKASALTNGFRSLTTGKPFQNCPKIQSIGAEINREVAAFRSFHQDVITYYFNPDKKPEQIQSYFENNLSELNQLMKYKYYYNEYQNRIQNGL